MPLSVSPLAFVVAGSILNVRAAFLPSSFAMYANMIAFAYALEPSSNKNWRRTLFATLAFATGAIVGWPFSAAVAIPFIFEEMFLYSGDTVSPKDRLFWRIARWRRLVVCGLVAALLLVGEILGDATEQKLNIRCLDSRCCY